MLLVVVVALVASFVVAVPGLASASPGRAAQVTLAAAASGGHASEEAAALAEAARTGKRVEVVADRTEYETVWANPDQTLSREISQDPIRVENEAGDLVPVDTDLKPEGGRLAPAASVDDVSFSTTGGGVLASADTPGAGSFSLGFDGALGAPARDGESAIYSISDVGSAAAASPSASASAGSTPAAEPAADSGASKLTLSAMPSGFTARITLDQAPTGGAPVFDFPLNLDGLTPALENGVLALRNGSGDVVSQTLPLSMWDSSRDQAGDRDHVAAVDAELVTVDGEQVLRLRPSLEWLTDPATQYPVTVDPDFTFDVDRDTYFFEGQSDTDPRGGAYNLRIGSDNGTRRFRAYEQFNTDALDGKVVTSAKLTLWQYYAGSCSARNMYVRPTQSLAPYLATWSNQPDRWPDDRYRTDKSFNHSTSCTGAAAPGFEDLDVTPIIAAWTSHDKESKGIALLAGNETDQSYENRFCSYDYDTTTPCDAASKRPVLTVTYQESDLGDSSSFAMLKHDLNDRTELKINTDNGNAVVKAQDLSMRSLGQDVTLTRYYNSLADATTPGVFGPKWTLSLGPDVYLKKRMKPDQSGYDPIRFEYHQPNGRIYGHFVRKGNVSTDPDWKSFSTPIGGIDSDLKEDTNGTFLLTKHDTQQVTRFSNLGLGSDVFYMTEVKDRSGNTITINYVSGTKKISTITDTTTERTISFTYTGSVVTGISESNGPTTRTWSYGYDNGRLASYTDPTSPLCCTTNYGWSDDAGSGGDPKVTSISDPANDSGSRPVATLGYSGGPKGQATSVRYSSSTTTSATIGYDLSYGDAAALSAKCKSGDDTATKVTSTDTTKNPTTYCFKRRGSDKSDRITRVKDGNGHTQSKKYNVDDQPSSFTAGTQDGSSGDTGSTVATYGGAGKEDQLKKLTDPKDDASSNTRGSTSLDYDTTGVPGNADDYLPSAKTDENGVCVSYYYDDHGRLTDAYNAQQIGCTKNKAGDHYQQIFNIDGTVQASADPNGSLVAGGPDQTNYVYWASTDSGYVTGTRGMLKAKILPGGDMTTVGTGTAKKATGCGASSRRLCDSYTYDGLARIVSMTDGRGKTTRYSYDARDRVAQVLVDGATTCVLAAGTCVKYVYDAEGSMTSRQDANGTTTFTYDRLNRQRQVTTPDGVVVAYTYNDDGKLTKLEQTLPGQSTDTVTYAYDQGNQPSSATDSAGTIDLTFNEDDKPKDTKFPTTAQVTVSRTYTGGGKDDKITVTKAGPGTDVLPDYNYDYDYLGIETNRVRKLTITGGGTGSDSMNDTATYDYTKGSQEVDKLKSVTWSTRSSETNTYSYDPAGNVRIEKKGSSTTWYGYDEAGETCWRTTTSPSTAQVVKTCTLLGNPGGSPTFYNRDDAGNNTGTTASPLTYNPYNQVATIEGRSQSYLDLGNDLRVGTGPNTMVNSNVGVISRTTTPVGGGASATVYYTRTPDGKILDARTPGTASATRYYVTDRQDSVVLIINPAGDKSAGYRYSAYGDPTPVEYDNTSTAAANPWRYISGYYESGAENYTKLGARYYDGHGHFTQEDSKPRSIEKPLDSGGYLYAGADPINSSDPTGRFDLKKAVGYALDGGVVAASVAVAFPLIADGVAGLAAGGAGAALLGAFGIATGGALIAAAGVAGYFAYKKISDS